jgi:hypothetical protein
VVPLSLRFAGVAAGSSFIGIRRAALAEGRSAKRAFAVGVIMLAIVESGGLEKAGPSAGNAAAGVGVRGGLGLGR